MAYLEARGSVLLALALIEQPEARDDALASLESAMRFAHRNEMIGSFVDEGEPLRRLIHDWRRSGTSAGIGADFLDRLDAAYDEVPADAGRATAPRICSDSVLTARELEVLDQMSRGLSNKQIGRALRLAPETIKWHLKNMFEKLGVNSRIEAVQIGLGLVSTTHRAATHREPRGSNAVGAGRGRS
jgi:LuxR family transcriptional regulator, maltose regulon positive regulatory protein